MDLSSVSYRGIHLRYFFYILSELRCGIISTLPISASSLRIPQISVHIGTCCQFPTAPLFQWDFSYSFRMGSLFLRNSLPVHSSFSCFICFSHLLSKTNNAGCTGGLKVTAAHLYSARSMWRTGVELRSREQMASHPLKMLSTGGQSV